MNFWSDSEQIAISPDSSMIAYPELLLNEEGSFDAILIKVRSLISGELIKTIKLDKQFFLDSISFSSDSRKLAYAVWSTLIDPLIEVYQF